MNASQPTLSNIDTCGYGSTISAQAVVLLPPEPQVSALDFVINTPLTHEQNIARMEWRIMLQTLGMQTTELIHSRNEEEMQSWKTKIENHLMRVNQKAQEFHPLEFPCDLVPPTLDYLVQNAADNWLEKLSNQLVYIFTNVTLVDIAKIELFDTDGILLQRNNSMPSSDNLPVLLEADNIIIPL